MGQRDDNVGWPQHQPWFVDLPKEVSSENFLFSMLCRFDFNVRKTFCVWSYTFELSKWVYYIVLSKCILMLRITYLESFMGLISMFENLYGIHFI